MSMFSWAYDKYNRLIRSTIIGDQAMSFTKEYNKEIFIFSVLILVNIFINIVTYIRVASWIETVCFSLLVIGMFLYYFPGDGNPNIEPMNIKENDNDLLDN